MVRAGELQQLHPAARIVERDRRGDVAGSVQNPNLAAPGPGPELGVAKGVVLPGIERLHTGSFDDGPAAASGFDVDYSVGHAARTISKR